MKMNWSTGVRCAVRLAVVVSIAFCGWSPHALACYCDRPTDPKDALASADVVFSGHVVSMALATRWASARNGRPAEGCDSQISGSDSGLVLCQAGEMVVGLQVLASWKGEIAEEIEVWTNHQQSACGFGFEIGQLYLVYANQRADGRFYTTGCYRTTRLAAAERDLLVLGEPVVDFWEQRAQRLGEEVQRR